MNEQRPNDIIASKLPPMDPEDRRRLIEQAKFEVWQLLQNRLAQTKAKKPTRADKHTRTVKKVEQRLLCMMEREIKTSHGAKPWSQRKLLALVARYRRIRRGNGAVGLTKGKRGVNHRPGGPEL
jgi:hypothetical protein